MKRLFLRIIHGICYLANVLFYYLIFPVSFIFIHRKHYWLISEVNFDARDNGLALFEYIVKNQPDIKCIYCINKNNPKYAYVKNLGKVIKPGSFKHLYYFCGAKYKVTTIVNGCVPNYYLKLYFKKHHPYGKNINLKHGIYKDFSPMDLKQNSHCDLICCGAKNEYKYILETYGYSEKEIKYTGLARFDKLLDATPIKRIMIMPTWRMWLDNVDYKSFKDSEYFKSWINFLNSDSISKAINKGYEVVFYLHPKMNKFKQIKELLPANIVVATSLQNDSNLTIEKLIATSALLITDFSSVFFDFAFMQRPTIYYQFDQDRFYKDQYKKSYFDYYNDGYGPVCDTLEKLNNSFNAYLNSDCKMETKYLDRAVSNFELRDNRNCERIVSEINKL